MDTDEHEGRPKADGRARSVEKLARRKADGALFEPSVPDDYNRADAIADCLLGRMAWYFRRVLPAPRRWWHRSPRWIRTGEVWEPTRPSEFEVLRGNDKVSNE